MKEKKWLTIPNLLSVLRILLVPAFVVSYLTLPSTDVFALWPMLILAFSGITDLFDGWIARRFNQISDLGKMLDPAADKLTQFSVLVCLVIRLGRMPMLWALLILYVVKDLLILIGGVLMLRGERRVVPQAKWFGKVSTFGFYLATILLIAFPNMPEWTINLLALVVILLALFSLIMYAVGFFGQKNETTAK